MNLGICPVCNGTGRVVAGDYKYKDLISGFDEKTDTLPCYNCGGQYMYGQPTGRVNLRSDGTPCVHKYTAKTVGRCLTQYTCEHCGNRYEIDSGD